MSNKQANSPAQAQPLEIWGGVEYTCNRVEDTYFDQMQISGHAHRPEDYELFANLGIRTLRFGALWERHELDPSWQCTDQHLACLRERNIRPIAGLIHHGSGPRHTSLLDREFPSKLAKYAASFAQRYPWIDAYTPVNEPNTTARFSGRYGIWYPHHMSVESYLRALLHQTKAIVLSMHAVRCVNPDAKLIQTDDLGRITGTEEMRSTWELSNERRWLPFDLLCGCVDRQHPLFNYMRKAGIREREILWFSDNPCPPDMIGANYYLTSDRYLDHRTDIYPYDRRSAEGPFVDSEKVRVCPNGITGFGGIIQDAWERYHIPVAITEVHLGGDVNDQIRWAAEAWEGAQQARQNGAACTAITFWALLGSFFWNHLVTCDNGHYEPGVFSVRHGSPVPTALAKVVAQMAAGQPPQHPALSEKGWWRHDSRLWSYAQQAHAERLAA
ncbi:MAG: glycoside hydrolase [Acidobacteria bacterium]|nr:glycoside hydrolase [Acidobacteriota bacterium]